LWATQFSTSFFLFLLIVVTSISYNYFAKADTFIAAEGATLGDNGNAIQGNPVVNPVVYQGDTKNNTLSPPPPSSAWDAPPKPPPSTTPANWDQDQLEL